jgi:hypothetical protein
VGIAAVEVLRINAFGHFKGYGLSHKAMAKRHGKGEEDDFAHNGSLRWRGLNPQSRDNMQKPSGFVRRGVSALI